MSKGLRLGILLLILAVLGGIYLYKNTGSGKNLEDKGYSYKSEQQTEEKQNNKPETDIEKEPKSTSEQTNSNPKNQDLGKQTELNPGTGQKENAQQAGKTSNADNTEKNKSDESTSKNLPMLIDLGAGTCIPCKMMQPILDEVKKEYEGKAVVKIIDVYENMDETMKYGIRAIPTQIFFDASGKEVFRHEGYMPKEEIVAKFKEMGIK